MRVLVIGYGSIGQRHEAVLRSMGMQTAVLSRHECQLDCPVFTDVREAIVSFDPHYIVVSNRTSEHFETLKQIQSASFSGTCLVEKPLASDPQEMDSGFSFDIWVGYIMRFHPLLQKAVQLLVGQKIWSVHSYVGQYLPDWRPLTDYRQCYSASKAQGGGVLRDLSHELDYILFMCGDWTRVSALGGQFSALEIETDDVYGLLLETTRCPVVLCQMNYLDRNVRRDCTIQYEGGTLYLDFIANEWIHNGTTEKVTLERNDMFEAMHADAMASRPTWLCAYTEAVQTLNLIAAAEQSSNEKKWIHKKI